MKFNTKAEKVDLGTATEEIENSRRGEPDFLLSNIEKANTILKWMPKRSNIKTILKDTYTWQLKLLKKKYS